MMEQDMIDLMKTNQIKRNKDNDRKYLNGMVNKQNDGVFTEQVDTEEKLEYFTE